MTWLFQKPELITVAGVVAVVVLTGIYFQTRAKPFLPAIGGVVAVVIGLLVVERIVVTDEEELMDTVDRIIRAVESGELDAVLQHVHPDAGKVREVARGYHDRYKFNYITITRMKEIRVKGDLSPPQAEMRFIVRVELTESTSGARYSPVGGVILLLTKENDRWLVHDYHLTGIDEILKKPNSDDR